VIPKTLPHAMRSMSSTETELINPSDKVCGISRVLGAGESGAT
jgi:hypothetical protein